MRQQILVLDDDTSLLKVMEYYITEAGFGCTCVETIEEAMNLYNAQPFDLVFSDLKINKEDGITFIRELKEKDPDAVIIAITGYPSVDVAVTCMKAGAFDFVQKPIEEEQLLSILKKAEQFSSLKAENKRLKAMISSEFSFGTFISRSPIMVTLQKQAQRIANSMITTLITGETGTGKEVLAKSIHMESSRKEKSFIAINCAAVPATLIESELFGHVKGAFTGAASNRRGLLEEANGGTFFMDEIGDLPFELQPKLLRVIQEKEFTKIGSNTPQKVDIRLLCATHRDLEKMVAEGKFREDLYFRINVVTLSIPPLRERREDILYLFQHFLHKACDDEKRLVPQLTNEAITLLENHNWSGNVRELQNVAYRCSVLIHGDSIDTKDLPFISQPATENKNGQKSEPNPYNLEEKIDQLYLEALELNSWNQTKTAAFLSISRNSLIYRLKRPILAEAFERWKKSGK